MVKPINEYYLWVEDGDNGKEGVVACAFLPSMGLAPLMARDYATAIKLRDIAERHAKASGHKVRLVRLQRERVMEEIDP